MSTSIIRPILSCLGLRRKHGKRSSKQFIEYERVQEKGIPHTNEIPDDVQIAADRFLATLLDADVASSTSSELHDSLRAATKDLVLTESLTSWLGQKILAGIQYAIEHKVEIGETMKHAIERAVGAAWDFAKEHPVYATIIALGVLVEIAPWVLGWLGFAEIGIVEGEHISVTLK